ncbi:artemin-like [Manacus candei]|uniref:artemin-like n=1 Tax=Manacus candei TaxID=415023 RepID=UPI0022277BDB|nr:artemin-like [Manacus candei]
MYANVGGDVTPAASLRRRRDPAPRSRVGPARPRGAGARHVPRYCDDTRWASPPPPRRAPGPAAPPAPRPRLPRGPAVCAAGGSDRSGHDTGGSSRLARGGTYLQSMACS